jgi:AP-2 complex subunit alpha
VSRLPFDQATWAECVLTNTLSHHLFAHSPIKLDASGAPDVAKNNKVIAGNKLGLLEGVSRITWSGLVSSTTLTLYRSRLFQIDPNPVNAVAAGVLHMSTGGKVGCLLRLEPNKDAKLCRLTIRSTNDE